MMRNEWRSCVGTINRYSISMRSCIWKAGPTGPWSTPMREKRCAAIKYRILNREWEIPLCAAIRAFLSIWNISDGSRMKALSWKMGRRFRSVRGGMWRRKTDISHTWPESKNRDNKLVFWTIRRTYFRRHTDIKEKTDLFGSAGQSAFVWMQSICKTDTGGRRGNVDRGRDDCWSGGARDSVYRGSRFVFRRKRNRGRSILDRHSRTAGPDGKGKWRLVAGI